MSNVRPHFWTADKISRLESLVSENRWSASQIGRILGCTRNMVIGKAARMKQTLLTPEEAAINRRSRPRVARVTPTQIPVVSENAPTSMNLEIEHLQNSSCHFPYGDNTPYTFCGHPVKPGAPYCDFHCRITRTPMMTNRAASDNAMVTQINSGGKRGMW